MSFYLHHFISFAVKFFFITCNFINLFLRYIMKYV